MFENILEKINFSKFFDILIDLAFKIVKFPVQKWNSLPYPLRMAVYIFLFLFAVFLFIVTIKKRDEWKYRY